MIRQSDLHLRHPPSIQLVTALRMITYDTIPEPTGRYVRAYGRWLTDAIRLDVAQSLIIRLNRELRLIEDTMPKPKSKPTFNPKQEYEFVRGELNAEQRKEAVEWIALHQDDYGTLAHEMLTNNYKISLSFDDYNDTFIASVTGKPDQPLNSFKILTGRGRNWELALCSALFKHAVLFNQGAWLIETASNDDFS